MQRRDAERTPLRFLSRATRMYVYKDIRFVHEVYARQYTKQSHAFARNARDARDAREILLIHIPVMITKSPRPI